MSTFAVNEAPSRCHRCRGHIAEGSLSVRWNLLRFDGTTTEATPVFYHPACWMDVNAEGFLQLVRGIVVPFDGRDELEAVAAARVLAAKAARMGPKARAKLGEIPVIEPAKDPTGRPRVRVLFIGNAATTDCRTFRSNGTYTVDEELRESVRDDTITSPLREYVLVAQRNSAKIPVDPSQPFVAGVMMMHTSTAPAPAYRSRIADWPGLGLPPPILCVLSDADRATVDGYVLKLRAMVEQCGYSGDECPVLTARSRDRALFEALALKLDEHVASARNDASGDAAVRAAEQLAKAVAQSEVEPVSQLLRRARKVARRARVAERQSMAASAQRCLLREETRRDAIALLNCCELPLDRALVLDAMRAMLEAESRPLNADFSALFELLALDEAHDEALDEFLLSALVAAKPASQRSKVVGELLTRSKRNETAAALRDAVAKAKGAMAARLAEVAIALERRQKRASS